MFGFVNVFKNELKIKDYNIFKAYYCGLCKTLGKKYNQLVRLGLSYDMTFLAIIADSLSDTLPVIKNQGCIKHTGKRPVCVGNDAISYSADISIIMAYHKLCDDISDEKSIKAFFARIPYVRAYRRASKRHPEIAKSARESILKLNRLEEEKCCHIDMVADTFATLTSEIFNSYDSSLASVGYNLGRFIYIADAFKDICDDIKHRSYNPYVCAYDEEFLKKDDFVNQVKGSLNMTLNALSEAYSKLSINKNKEILDNIIYMGLRFAYDNLFNNIGGNK